MHLVANFNIGIFSHYHASTATLALLLNLFKIHLNFNSINGPSFESFSLADHWNLHSVWPDWAIMMAKFLPKIAQMFGNL